MAEQKTYKCVYPNWSIAGLHGLIRFDYSGRYATSDEDEQELIEGHEWFGRIIHCEADAVEKIGADDEDMLAKAMQIASLHRRPEAKQGTVGSSPPPEETKPEPAPLPSAQEINYMKKVELKKLVKAYGMDVDANLPYHVLKAAVQTWVKKRQLSME